MVRRVFVEKKPEFAVKAKELQEEIRSYLGIQTVTGVLILLAIHGFPCRHWLKYDYNLALAANKHFGHVHVSILSFFLLNRIHAA